MRSLARRVIFLALPALLAPAMAQTVEFGVAYPASVHGNRRVEVAFAAVPSGSGTVGLRLAAGDELELGLRLRQADSLAAIGNVVTVLAVDASTGGRYAAAITGRAVLGPVALRLRGSASDGLEPLAPLAEGAFGPLPVLGPGQAVLGLEAGITYRASRAVIVDFAPGAFLRAGQVGGRVESELRLVRALSGNDLSLLAHAFLEPAGGRFAGSLGAGYTLARRRAPSWSFVALVGWSPAGVAPGARVAGGERLAAGQLDLQIAAEPYRLDARPYRARLDYRVEVGPGELRLGLTGGLEPGSGWRLGAGAGYRMPFSP
jgi:hypothetical protein